MFFADMISRKKRQITKSAKAFWEQTKAGKQNVRLQVEALENRINPDVTASLANGILTLENDANAGELLTFKVDGANIKVSSVINNIQNGGGVVVAGNNAFVPIAGVKAIEMSTDPTTFLDVTGNSNFAGMTDLRNVIYSGSVDPVDNIDLSGNTNPNIYFRLNTQGSVGSDEVKMSPVGINILQFTDSKLAAGSVKLTMPNEVKVALDFSRLTKAAGVVSINLSSPRELIGGYAGMDLRLTFENSTEFVDVVVGGPGDDVLIGNDNPNLLLGMDGGDTLIGNGGNDQVNANRDYSPDVDGEPNGTGPAGLDDPFDQFDDMTKFNSVQNNFNGQAGISPTSVSLFDQFGVFGFGQGTGDFQADFQFANNLQPANSSDLLNGGDGDDGLFGFNDASVTVLGGLGNDIYSTNVRGGSALIDMGGGEDTLLFTNGDTAIGGAGADLITPSGRSTINPNALSFLFGEADRDTINGIVGPDEIRPGNEANVIGGDLNGDTLFNESGVDSILSDISNTTIV